MTKTTTARFAGLTLSAADRRELQRMQRGGAELSARTWRRIRTLLLLDEGYTATAAGEAVGGYKREASRIGKRYLDGGLEHALSDDPRPKPAKMLDSVEEAALIALVCGPPPEGRARWSVRLVTSEAIKRGIVPRAGRELVRLVLADHDLKPWREKNVVRAEDRRRVPGAHGGRAAPVRAATKRR